MRQHATTMLMQHPTMVLASSLTNAAYVAEAALLKALVTATAIFSTSVVFVEVTASLLAIATAMAINSMPWAYAEVLAPMTPMKTAFVTMPTIVWVPLDACGVCNGPGEIYACGCSDIPAGDCDCDGNQLDALGTCGGGCAADVDADGICDDVDPCVGQLDECGVCNGDGSSCADPCAAAGQSSAYTMTVESSPAAGAGGTVYRFYVNSQDPSDKMSAVFGNDLSHLVINTPRAFSIVL